LDLATLTSCAELTTEHAKQAASSSAEMRTLLNRVAQIAEPGAGCPKLLMALARLAGQDWLEGGELRVELAGDDASTTIIVMCDYGFGIRERLLSPVELPVPLDEFSRALELSPKLVLPLRITDEEGKIILTPLLSPEKHDGEAFIPVRIDEASLGEQERKTAPPQPGAEPEAVFAAAPDSDGPHVNERSPGEAPMDELEEIGPGDGDPADPADPLPDAGAIEMGSLQPGPVSNSWTPGSVHTRPTVRRMVAVDVSALRRPDPRREEED
jgi:hypothetical protein